MSDESRTPDLNSERTFRYIEATKVYLLKVTFNLRTLIYDLPRSRKFKRALRRYRSACKRAGSTDISSVSGRVSSNLIYQYYKYSTFTDVQTRAIDEYQDYYDDLKARLKKLRCVKSYAKWKITSGKRKERVYNEIRDANRALKKEYNEGINRLLFKRARALGAKKDIIWNEYLKDPESIGNGLEAYLDSQ